MFCVRSTAPSMRPLELRVRLHSRDAAAHGMPQAFDTPPWTSHASHSPDGSELPRPFGDMSVMRTITYRVSRICSTSRLFLLCVCSGLAWRRSPLRSGSLWDLLRGTNVYDNSGVDGRTRGVVINPCVLSHGISCAELVFMPILE